jgi:hypothetical protein
MLLTLIFLFVTLLLFLLLCCCVLFMKMCGGCRWSCWDINICPHYNVLMHPFFGETYWQWETQLTNHVSKLQWCWLVHIKVAAVDVEVQQLHWKWKWVLSQKATRDEATKNEENGNKEDNNEEDTNKELSRKEDSATPFFNQETSRTYTLKTKQSAIVYLSGSMEQYGIQTACSN